MGGTIFCNQANDIIEVRSHWKKLAPHLILYPSEMSPLTGPVKKQKRPKVSQAPRALGYIEGWGSAAMKLQTWWSLGFSHLAG